MISKIKTFMHRDVRISDVLGTILIGAFILWAWITFFLAI